jgi:membrane protein implicated in regulation of membrane protease activity
MLMKRTAKLSGLAYVLSATGVVLVGVVAALLLRDYPVTGGIVLLAALVALFGLGSRWLKRVQRRRRRKSLSMLEI